jgi:hypothetical protein
MLELLALIVGQDDEHHESDRALHHHGGRGVPSASTHENPCCSRGAHWSIKPTDHMVDAVALIDSDDQDRYCIPLSATAARPCGNGTGSLPPATCHRVHDQDRPVEGVPGSGNVKRRERLP